MVGAARHHWNLASGLLTGAADGCKPTLGLPALSLPHSTWGVMIAYVAIVAQVVYVRCTVREVVSLAVLCLVLELYT